MEYQKMINLLDNTQNEPSKFRIQNTVIIIQKHQEVYGMAIL